MANNDEEFERLYKRYFDRAVAFIAHFGFSKEEARDLAQDTFIRVYRSMEQYHQGGWSYIETTARRVVFNRFRDAAAAKRAKALTVSADDTLLDLPDKASSPEELAALRERLARADADIKKLPKNQRDCIYWYAAGYSYAEIATILGTSEATVKSRMHEARNTLNLTEP